MESKFDQVFGTEAHKPQTPGCFDKRLPFTMEKGETGVLIQIGVSGCTADDVDIDLEGTDLTVRVTAGFQANYVRQFRVSEGIDEDDISAAVKNGLLTIRVKHTPVPEPLKVKIPVTSPLD